MKSILKFAAILCLCMQMCTSNFANAQNQDGFVDLVDGVSLSGWNVVGNANWVIGKGVIEGNKPVGFLVSTKSYKNFILKAEFWAESNTNSGIFIRCQDPNKITAANGYEVNIWDTRPEQAYATGANCGCCQGESYS